MSRKDNRGRNLHIGEDQRKDGKYMYRYTNERSGKRCTIYADDLAQLRLKEKQVEKDLEDNIITDSVAKKMTLNDLFEYYMTTRVISDATRMNYSRMWKKHIQDEIGNIKVVQLRNSHIKALYAKMSVKGYKRSTIKLLHTMLYPTLELAVDDDIIRKNPARNALQKNCGMAAKEKEALTLEQQRKLLDFMKDSHVYNVYLPMFVIMLETGLRCGELIGLTYGDLDLAKKEISVNHQLIYKNYGDGCKFHISDPKTDAGVRVIPLTENAYEAFCVQLATNELLDKKCEVSIDGYTDFIFLAKTGRPLMPGAVNDIFYNVIDAYNKKETEKAKLENGEAELMPKISAHIMRHTACTNMSRKGMQVKILQHIMGHANCDITMNVYNHVTSDMDVRNEIERCERVNI